MPKIGYRHTVAARKKIKAKRALQDMSFLKCPRSETVRANISIGTKAGMSSTLIRKKVSLGLIKYFAEHPEAKDKLRQYRLNQKFSKETNIEKLIEAELQFRHIQHEKQVAICGFIVDFYVPEYRLIIECDGDYWHNLPGRQVRDRMKDATWKFQGFKVYRFWEHEINTSPAACVNKIVEFSI